MSTITKTIHLYAKAPSYGTEPELWVSTTGNLKRETFGRIVASQEVTFEVPDMNLTAMAIEELEAEKAEAAKQFAATVARINDRLAKLQAISNEVPA